MKDYRLVIAIDGESAKELFAVGPNDLKDYFLPEYLNIDPDDVVTLTFHEVVPPTESIFKQRSVHADNYYRDKVEEVEK